jgi:hypothetical protein
VQFDKRRECIAEQFNKKDKGEYPHKKVEQLQR